MAQFKIYTSADAGGPGQLTGQAGTLVTLLQACLVNGYGAYTAAGWTEPIAAAGNIAAFKQGGGSGFHCLINDNGPNVTSTYREAWATGWETLAGIGAPVGTGGGQFPTPAQLLVTGHGVIRKSTTADAVGRDWVVFADDRTFYLFTLPADTAGIYSAFGFGDIYSHKSTADAYSCMILSRALENASTNQSSLGATVAGPTTSLAGAFMARTYSGAGGSILIGVQGDIGKGSTTALVGTVQYPNGPDNALYMSPLWVYEVAAGAIRGRLRGLYHICHTAASFADSQTFSGAGDYAGKTFQVVKPIRAVSATGTDAMLAVETSDTLDTN